MVLRVNPNVFRNRPLPMVRVQFGEGWLSRTARSATTAASDENARKSAKNSISQYLSTAQNSLDLRLLWALSSPCCRGLDNDDFSVTWIAVANLLSETRVSVGEGKLMVVIATPTKVFTTAQRPFWRRSVYLHFDRNHSGHVCWHLVSHFRDNLCFCGVGLSKLEAESLQVA